MNLIAAYERRCAQVYVAAKQEADKMTRSELEAVLAETEPHSVLSWVNFFCNPFYTPRREAYEQEYQRREELHSQPVRF